MRRGEGLSRLLVEILIPLCAWGLISSLLVHLVHVRALLIQGGEWRLRQATLAFAAAVILIQRLSVIHGRSTARAYAVALGAAITLFSAHNAWAYRLPVHPLLVFLANVAFFAILWWVGHRISSACAADSDEAEAIAAESGILSRRQRTRREPRKELSDKDREALWAERLPKRHPGLVILAFSLFAIPAFGLGIYLFDGSDPAVRAHLGILLFIYLWCAFSLLLLSSQGQLRSYFAKRDVTLPELVGLTWLGIGLLGTTTILGAAFFLPQPSSLSTLFVRDRIVSTYRGWESRYGVRDTVGKGANGTSAGQARQPLTGESVKGLLKERHANIDQLNDPYLSDVHRSTGMEPEYRNLMTLTAATNDSLRDAFDWVLKILAVLVVLSGVFVACVVVVAFWSAISQGIADLSWMRKTSERKSPWLRRGRKKPEPPWAANRFLRYADPFGGAAPRRDGDALVRYLWEATLAFCEDFGTPCPADRTPFEYVAGEPEALKGFEESARYIAGMFTFSEFSGRPILQSASPQLKQYWSSLEEHVRHKSASR